MPRFMVMIKGNSRSEAGVVPSEKLQAQMAAYNEELVGAGVRLAAEGLYPSSKGARVYFSGGSSKVVDGPFAEAKEVVGVSGSCNAARSTNASNGLDEFRSRRCLGRPSTVRSTSSRYRLGGFRERIHRQPPNGRRKGTLK